MSIACFIPELSQGTSFPETTIFFNSPIKLLTGTVK
jgi:hypothetical protein